MEFKVRALAAGEEKSVSQKEEEIIKKEEAVDESSLQNKNSDTVDLNEDDVISFLKKKSGREFSSIEDLFKAPTSSSVDIPDDVQPYLKFKEDTGRGFEDFLKVTKDYNKEDPNKLLREYYSQTESELDEDEIDYLVSKFSYDEDLDDDSDIKSKKIEKKKELEKAKNYFNELKEKYKAPLESRESGLSKDEIEEFKAYKARLNEAKDKDSQDKIKSDWFAEKSKELFNDEFKGFEFNVGDKNLVFNPSNKDELVSVGGDIQKFVSKFVDEKGLLKDAKSYQKSLAAAMNTEKFAKHFYEQGIADAIDSEARKLKNIKTDPRASAQFTTVNGLKIRAVGENGGGKMTVKTRS